MMRSEADINCIAMKREIQSEIYEQTKDLSDDAFTQYMYDRIRNSRFAKLLKENAEATPE